jgi:hypothetical protein
VVDRLIQINAVDVHDLFDLIKHEAESSVRSLVTIIALYLFLLAPARAQQSLDGVRPEQSSLSGLMIAVQLQHTKLWFAGKFGNWRLAAYELDQITANLAEAVVRSLAASTHREPVESRLSALRKSIDETNVAEFTRAYTELTHECNACHRGTGREFISVQVPLASPFTDQAFPDQVAEGRSLAHAICAACHVLPDKSDVAPASGIAAPSVAVPSFSDLIQRPSFSDATLRQLLGSSHRRVGSKQAMLNPRLTESQIELIVAYFDMLKVERNRQGGPK